MSNFPPGVTGNEFQISGPSREWEEDLECPKCGSYAAHYCAEHPDQGAWMICTTCDQVSELDDNYEPVDVVDIILDPIIMVRIDED